MGVECIAYSVLQYTTIEHCSLKWTDQNELIVFSRTQAERIRSSQLNICWESLVFRNRSEQRTSNWLWRNSNMCFLSANEIHFWMSLLCSSRPAICTMQREMLPGWSSHVFVNMLIEQLLLLSLLEKLKTEAASWYQSFRWFSLFQCNNHYSCLFIHMNHFRQA